MPKTKTIDQVVAMKEKAIRFLQNVVGDPGRAEQFDEMSPYAYAEHKGIRIENPSSHTINPRRFNPMPGTILTKAELEDRVAELEEENQDLQDRIDSIADIIEPDEDEESD